MSDPVQNTAAPGRGEQPLYAPVEAVKRRVAEVPAPESADGPEPRYTSPYPPYPSDVPDAPGLSNNVASGLAYFMVPAVFFLLLEPYRRNALVRFHSWQSVFLFIGVAVIRSVEQMFVAILPSAIAFTVSNVFSLVLFAAWLICVVKAFQGSKYLLPLLGSLAEQTAASPSGR